MGLVLEIVLGLMILASFFVAYLSAKNWPIYQVVLVVFVLLAATGFFYLGARTLATHNAWGKFVKDNQDEFDRLTLQTRQLIEGGPPGADGAPTKGIRQLDADLEKLITERGGAVFEATVSGIKEGVVQLTFKTPAPALIANTVVFAFDEATRDQGGVYRGEYKVTALGENGATAELAPNLPLTPAQEQGLASAKGPWTLYTMMPIDNAAVFAGLDEATRQSLLPAPSVAEFANAERPLRDYEYFFHEDYLQRALLADAISKINADLQRMADDTKRAIDEVTYRTKEKGDLGSDLAKLQGEERAIAAYQQALTGKLQQVRDSLKDTYLKNKQLAADLTRRQMQAADEINRRTAPVATP